jgi:ADP-ribose pyrophosphatase YjhB (NUDIX family)
VSDRGFERLGGETVYSGRLVEVRIERFRHADGEEVSREIVRHRGAVGVVAYDAERVWLVRQPREAVAEPELLEIPAGRLDVDGEQPLQAARRELAEEVGLAARRWEPILSYYSSAGSATSAFTCSPRASSASTSPTAARRSGSRSSPGRLRGWRRRSRSAATPRR